VGVVFELSPLIEEKELPEFVQLHLLGKLAGERR